MSGSADRAVLDYYAHDGSDPVRIVDEALRQQGAIPSGSLWTTSPASTSSMRSGARRPWYLRTWR
jgi:hypothetical protein